MNGVLLINKETDMTSRDVVNIACKYLKTKKIGHTGTLDPLATGVLVLCIGKYTKLVEIITSYEKEYEAEITLGYDTDTLDSTGTVLKEENIMIKKDKIELALKEMAKTYMQEVPAYSAIKKDGIKLYEYARNNIEIEPIKREVTIKKLELISDIEYKNNKTIFKIKCLVSKGTYIRSLIRDIASYLNTIGIMSSLKRTKQGNFDINDCYKIDDIKNGTYKFLSEDEIFKSFDSCIVSDEEVKKIKNGSILDNIYNLEVLLFKDKNNNNLAIYKTYEKDKSKIKPWKMFI